MESSHNHYTIKKGELLLLFILLIIGGGLVFAVGVRIGKNVLQNDCQAILEENQKKIEGLETKKVTPTTEAENSETNATIKDVNVETADNTKSATATKETKNLAIKEITSEIKGKYTIQISSYQDEEEAQKEATNLYSSGYKLAYYMEAEVPGKGVWYRVGVGFFEKKSSAEMFANMLKKQGKITSYIVKRVS